MSEELKKEYLEFARQIAYEAGEIMKRYFGKSPDSHFKSDDTIVTIADEEINEMVIRHVNMRYPDHGVDGEEASELTGSKNLWVCDPVDGTNPFSVNLAVSVFSLAFVHDGTPLVGVIYDPFADRLYWAYEGGGAFVNDEKIRVNDKGLVPKSLVSYDQWALAEYDILTPLAKLAQSTGLYMLSPGSTTHMAALVAQGSFVASIFPGTKGKNVDIAAAKIIVEEAGGRVTDMLGNDQRYDRDINGAIVSNGIVHDDLVEVLRGAKR